MELRRRLFSPRTGLPVRRRVSARSPRPEDNPPGAPQECESDNDSDSEDDSAKPVRRIKRGTKCTKVRSTSVSNTSEANSSATVSPTSSSSSYTGPKVSPSTKSSPAVAKVGSKDQMAISPSPTAGALINSGHRGHSSKVVKEALTATGVIVGLRIFGLAAWFLYRRFLKKKHTEANAYGENETVSFGNRRSQMTERTLDGEQHLTGSFPPPVPPIAPPSYHTPPPNALIVSRAIGLPLSPSENLFDDSNEATIPSDAMNQVFDIGRARSEVSEILDDRASIFTGSIARFHTTPSWSKIKWYD